MKSLICNGCITQMLGVICQPGLSRRARSALQGKELDTVLSLFTLLSPPPFSQWRGMQISPPPPPLPILAPFTCPSLSQSPACCLDGSPYSVSSVVSIFFFFRVTAFIITGGLKSEEHFNFGQSFCFGPFPSLVLLIVSCLRSVPPHPAKRECGSRPITSLSCRALELEMMGRSPRVMLGFPWV